MTAPFATVVTAANRSRIASRILQAGLLAAVGALLICGYIVVRTVLHVGSSLHPHRNHVTPPALTGSLAQMRDVSFVTPDHLTIRGWYIPSKNRAAVILAHGMWANRTQMLFEARSLADQGFGVLLFDWRAQGESDGTVSTWGDKERDDLRAAIAFVKSQSDISPEHIGALGCSLGGFVIADIAPEEKTLRAIALSAMATSLDDVIHDDYRKWGPLSQITARWTFRHGGADPDMVRPIDAVGRISPRPVLFLNGKHDIDSPLWQQEALYNAAKEPKSHWDLDGVEYGDFGNVDPKDYRAVIVSFFEKNLLGKPRTVSQISSVGMKL